MKSLKPLKFALEPLFKIASEKEEQNPDNYGFGQLAVHLADFIGYPYRFVSYYEYGKPFANGSWSGLRGLMDRAEAEISVSKSVMKSLSSQEFTFSYPIEIVEITFATRRLIPSPNPNAIFQPFSTSVWFLFAISMLAMALAYLYFFRKRNFSDSVFSVLATASRQPPLLDPKTSSQRIVMGSWLLGMTIITAAYMSLLLSHVTFPNLRGVENILELANAVEKGEYECFTSPDHPHTASLLNSNVKSQRFIGKNLIAATLLEFKYSSSSKVAFIEVRSLLKGLSTFVPDLVISEDSFYTISVAFVMRKDFGFKEKLNRAIRRLIEIGIYDKVTSLPIRKATELEVTQLIRNLTLLDFKTAFFNLLVGCGVSILIFLLEILAFKLKRLKTRKKA